ncbi:MAG TPA: cellulose biosynthesis cyclic di-GMP-binding regulatory protein BcsB, partial [Phenylobacterium sp.]|nr:cellulose biosynthesis cyclic di-GMP-binding regulatory protein BcsB [Phenylobacterium sp.]
PPPPQNVPPAPPLGPSSPVAGVSHGLALFAATGLLALAIAAPASSAWAQAAPFPSPAANAAADPASPSIPDVNTTDASSGVRRVQIRLRDLGVEQPLRLVSVDGEAGLPFRLGAGEVVTNANLVLNYAHSPALLADLSHLTVTMNGEVVSTLPLTAATARGRQLVLPVDPALMLVDNRLGLRFTGHYTRECEDPMHSSLWAVVSNTRTVLDLTITRIPAVPDLARLPAPFFDNADRALSLPFVFVGAPDRQVLQGAGALASYFGALARYRGFGFPVLIGALPEADGVVFMVGPDTLGLGVGDPRGPTLSLAQNPRNPLAQLLVVQGRDATEVLQAALTLSLGAPGLGGVRAELGPPMLAQRAAYDAPRWLPTRRPVRLDS